MKFEGPFLLLSIEKWGELGWSNACKISSYIEPNATRSLCDVSTDRHVVHDVKYSDLIG